MQRRDQTHCRAGQLLRGSTPHCSRQSASVWLLLLGWDQKASWTATNAHTNASE